MKRKIPASKFIKIPGDSGLKSIEGHSYLVYYFQQIDKEKDGVLMSKINSYIMFHNITLDDGKTVTPHVCVESPSRQEVFNEQLFDTPIDFKAFYEKNNVVLDKYPTMYLHKTYKMPGHMNRRNYSGIYFKPGSQHATEMNIRRIS